MKRKSTALGLTLVFLASSASAGWPPSPPGNFDYSYEDQAGLTLTWDPPYSSGSSDLEKYIVYGIEGGVEMDPVELDVTVTEFQPAVQADTEYTFSVTAKNQQGLESARVTLVIFTRLHYPPCQPITAPPPDLRPECLLLL